MSVSTRVFINVQRMPTLRQWQDAIRQRGFDVELVHFDPLTDSGFRPATYRGRPAGFEYGLSKLDPDEWDDDIREAAAEKDSYVDFTTHSDLAEFVSAVIAAGVLAEIADGVVFDDGAQIIRGAVATSWARDVEKECEADLR
jgi:hypothetical protein